MEVFEDVMIEARPRDATCKKPESVPNSARMLKAEGNFHLPRMGGASILLPTSYLGI